MSYAPINFKLCSQILTFERDEHPGHVETLHTGKEPAKLNKGHTLIIDQEDLLAKVSKKLQ